MTGTAPARGDIWWVEVGPSHRTRFVIVSNDARNRHLAEVLGVRMTTAPKPDLPSVAAFGAGEVDRAPAFAVADDILPIPKDRLTRRAGTLSLRQMAPLEEALRAALDL